MAGFDPMLVSGFRSLDMAGDAEMQARLLAQASEERDRLQDALDANPPKLWFTYHCYYKAPDLLGPELAETLGIPYAISEPSISAKRRDGPWAGFANRSEAAISRADRLFWTTGRDRTALEDADLGAKMVHLPAFVEEMATQTDRERPHVPLRLLSVAMMRPGDKVESYRRLAAALEFLDAGWHLTIVGDGSERSAVEKLFQPFGDRVAFLGQIDCPERMTSIFDAADLFVWPGVGEGVGMVYLEAQAAGLPVVAEAHPAPAELVAGGCVPPGNAQAYARRIEKLMHPAVYRAASTEAIAHVSQRHSLKAASGILKRTLDVCLQ